MIDNIVKTKKNYSFLWTRDSDILPQNRWHFNSMQEVINESIVRGITGIDVGSGCGYDTYIMAKNNPSVRIVSLDLSDGVYSCKGLTSAFRNVMIIKSSVLDTPIKDDIFDFAYCYGVLHHTSDPTRGLREIRRILKKDAPVFLYLYEDHSDNAIKYFGVKIVTLIRKITIRIPTRLLYFISCLVSPFIVLVFSYPAKLFRRFKLTYGLYEKMPFNFGNGLFSLRGDIFDRLGTPIEHRFSKKEVVIMLSSCGFYNVSITKLKDTAGLVVWGYKK